MAGQKELLMDRFLMMQGFLPYTNTLTKRSNCRNSSQALLISQLHGHHKSKAATVKISENGKFRYDRPYTMARHKIACGTQAATIWLLLKLCGQRLTHAHGVKQKHQLFGRNS